MNFSHFAKKILRQIHPIKTPIPKDMSELQNLCNLFNSGDRITAIKRGRDFAAANPTEHSAQYTVGYFLEQDSQSEKAEFYLREANNLFPGNYEYSFRLLLVLLALSKNEEALLVADSVLKLERNKAALVVNAELLIKLERFDRAYPLLLEALGLDRSDEKIKNQLSSLVLNCFSPTEARKRYLEIFSDKDPSSVLLLQALPLAAVKEINGNQFHNLGEPLSHKIVAPSMIGNPIGIETGIGVENSPYILEMNDVSVFSQCNVVKLSDSTAFYDLLNHPRAEIANLSFEPLIKSHHGKSLLVDFNNYQQLEVEEGFFLMGALTSAYGHWSFEFLPKLLNLQKLDQFKKSPIYVDQDMPQTHFDMLKKIVGDKRAIILVPPKTRVNFKKLIFSPTINFLPYNVYEHKAKPLDNGLFSPQIIEFLRSRVLPTPVLLPTSQRRRLYLDRSHAQWRKLANEQEVVSHLARFGFEVVKLQDLSFEQQVEIIQSAECVIGASGSAMNNTMFCHPNCKIGILSPPNLGNYVSWANAMKTNGLDVLFACGEHKHAHKEQSKHSDFTIPLELLAQALRELNITKEGREL